MNRNFFLQFGLFFLVQKLLITKINKLKLQNNFYLEIIIFLKIYLNNSKISGFKFDVPE